MRVGLALALLASCSAACTSDLVVVPGTTTRVEKPVVAEGTELELKIFTREDECRALKPEDLHLCLPHVDRNAGEVRLAFQFRLDSDDWPVPLTKEHIQVSHLGTVIQDGVNGQAYTVIPHDPVRAKELFILVIDGSSSMWEDNRMEKVRAALLSPAVKDSFFPGTVKTGVVVAQFTDGAPVPLGGEWKVIEDKQDFARLVKENLRVLSGYTHLYNAVRDATGTILQQPDIERWLKLEDASPTIVALTDGFNNMARDDLCRTNAERLDFLLKHLKNAREGEGVSFKNRPSVFTVGLGRPLRKRFELPEDALVKVKPVDLCGKKYVDRRIDGDLENFGIDNASMKWIAKAGGGFSFVKNDKKGLAEAFQGAAAVRYYWFEVRYRLDPFYLRRSFKTGLRLQSYASAEASVVIHPSAWLDGPPGTRGPDGWVDEQSYRHTATVVMPALGLLVAASFFGAAGFNIRRALFGRTRRPAPPKRRAPPPAAPPGANPR